MAYFTVMGSDHISDSLVEAKIFHFRRESMMLDFHLAELYGVKTKVLKKAVRRNFDRFPADFMFELNDEEFDHLRSQFVTSNSGGHRYAAMASTEHGVLMLSIVLRSESAVQMNIQIMQIFRRMREALMEKKEMLLKIEQLEK
jgi:phage regulator Rha-like protein